MKPRPAGGGSVTELGPGRFWARGPRPERRSLKVWPTREEAQAVVDGAVELLAGEARTHVPGATLRAFGGRVVGERAIDLPRSAAATSTRWKYICEAPFVDDPIEALGAPTIDRWARQLARRVPGSARCTVSLLSAICGQAVREGLLEHNPCASVRVRLPPRTHDPWTYLLPDEQRAVLAAPIPEIDALQIGCLLGTGVRDGELFSLRLADVHVDARKPHIVVRYGSPLGPPKGKKIRIVPLFGLGLRSFRRWLAVLPGYCPENPRGLAFPGPRGGFQQSGEFLVRQTRNKGERIWRDDFRGALAVAGIVAERRHDGRPVRAHDLRHTFAASLVSGWWGSEPWRLEDLCAVMGHSSITITERYAHLAPGRVLELAARSPGLLPGDGSPAALALQAAKHAPIALLGAGTEGTGCSSAIPQIHGKSAGAGPSRNPPITREQAIAGLRALALGDVAAAALLALGVNEAGLRDIFEEALLADQGEAGERAG